MRSSGPTARQGAPERDRRAAARRRGRRRRPGADRRRARRRSRRSASSAGGGGPARRPPRDGGAGRRRARRGAATCCGRSSPAARSSRPRSPWAVRHELALSLDDVLARRTRLAQELPDRGAADRAARRRRSSAPSSAGATPASASRSRPTSRRRAASSRCRRRATAGPPDGAVDDRRTDADRVIGPSRGRAPRFGDASIRRPRSERSSTACTRTGSWSASARRSSRSSCSRWSHGGSAGSRPRAAIPREPASVARRSCLVGRPAARLVPRVAALDPDRARSSPTPRRRRQRRRRPRRPPRPAARRPPRRAATPRSPTPPPTPGPADAVRAARRSASGSFHGTDDFHFGRGTATIIETAPGAYTLRLDDFSVRNGPDLYVYLSPTPTTTPTGALEAGASSRRPTAPSATTLPAGHGPGRLRERDHLVQAVLAPVRGRAARAPSDARRIRRKSGYWQRVAEARTIPPVNATEGSVARYVARRNSDSSHG